MCEYGFSRTRSFKSNGKNISNFCLWSAGHHHHSIGKKYRFVYIMCNHNCGNFFFVPDFYQNILQFTPCQKNLTFQKVRLKKYFGFDGKRSGNSDTLLHSLGKFRSSFVKRTLQSYFTQVVFTDVFSFFFGSVWKYFFHTRA